MAELETLARPLAARIQKLHAAPLTAVAEPDIADNVIEAAGAALDRGETHYTDRPGIAELRTLIAERLNTRYGLNIQPPAVTVTCGSTEARFCAVQVLAEKALICPGDAAAVADLAALNDVPLLRSGEGAPAESALYLTPADDTEALLAQAVTAGWWVIWDVSGMEAPDFNPAQNPELAARVVTIDDLEGQMPGWRIGWMAGSDKWSVLRGAKQALTICSTSVSQWAALEYMRSNP
jgi:DNA-binding transcriptional MocR family regulator